MFNTEPAGSRHVGGDCCALSVECAEMGCFIKTHLRLILMHALTGEVKGYSAKRVSANIALFLITVCDWKVTSRAASSLVEITMEAVVSNRGIVCIPTQNSSSLCSIADDSKERSFAMPCIASPSFCSSSPSRTDCL